jgi:hypothetical protein
MPAVHPTGRLGARQQGFSRATVDALPKAGQGAQCEDNCRGGAGPVGSVRDRDARPRVDPRRRGCRRLGGEDNAIDGWLRPVESGAGADYWPIGLRRRRAASRQSSASVKNTRSPTVRLPPGECGACALSRAPPAPSRNLLSSQPPSPAPEALNGLQTAATIRRLETPTSRGTLTRRGPVVLERGDLASAHWRMLKQNGIPQQFHAHSTARTAAFDPCRTFRVRKRPAETGHSV